MMMMRGAIETGKLGFPNSFLGMLSFVKGLEGNLDWTGDLVEAYDLAKCIAEALGIGYIATALYANRHRHEVVRAVEEWGLVPGDDDTGMTMLTHITVRLADDGSERENLLQDLAELLRQLRDTCDAIAEAWFNRAPQLNRELADDLYEISARYRNERNWYRGLVNTCCDLAD